eukprot:354318-Chlamydomonas_euryale.AAC.6
MHAGAWCMPVPGAAELHARCMQGRAGGRVAERQYTGAPPHRLPQAAPMLRIFLLIVQVCLLRLARVHVASRQRLAAGGVRNDDVGCVGELEVIEPVCRAVSASAARPLCIDDGTYAGYSMQRIIETPHDHPCNGSACPLSLPPFPPLVLFKRAK